MRKTPVVLGVLSIIFGAVVAVYAAVTPFVNSGMTKLVRAGGQIQAEATTAAFDAQRGYLQLTTAVYVPMSLALLFIGIGLYRRRVWARRAAIGWSLVGVVWLIVSTVIAIGWMVPQSHAARLAVYAAHGVRPPFDISTGAQISIVIFAKLFYAPFPVVLLALLGRRSAANDFPSA
jgi:hypothetical protein